MNTDTTRGKVLAKAGKLVHGSRNRDYGPPQENFQRTAVMWNAYIAGKETLTASGVHDDGLTQDQPRVASSRRGWVCGFGRICCAWR